MNINTNFYQKLRRHSRKILFSMTDGLYRSNTNKTTEEKDLILKETKENFPLCFAIGYGSSVNEEELVSWASSQDMSLLLDSVEELEKASVVVLDKLYEDYKQFSPVDF